MKKVISVKPLEGKKVAVVFSDGASGVFDVTPYERKLGDVVSNCAFRQAAGRAARLAHRC